MIVFTLLFYIQLILVFAKAFGFLDLNWSLTLLPLIFFSFLSFIVAASVNIERRESHNDDLE